MTTLFFWKNKALGDWKTSNACIKLWQNQENNQLVANNMTNDQHSKFQAYKKRAWVIYALLTIALIVVLVLFVAEDNEERFFFSIMPAAAAYVLRPTDRYMGELIFKFTGVSPPSENE